MLPALSCENRQENRLCQSGVRAELRRVLPALHEHLAQAGLLRSSCGCQLPVGKGVLVNLKGGKMETSKATEIQNHFIWQMNACVNKAHVCFRKQTK